MAEALHHLHEILKAALIEDPTVWRNELLIPGDWEQPPEDESAAILARLVEDQRQAGYVPLPLLFRVLAARRLTLGWAAYDLWAFAVNVDFDIGILDVFVPRDPAQRKPVLVPELLPGSFVSLAPKSTPAADNINPAVVWWKLRQPAAALSEASAIQCVNLCIGLSRREQGRFRILSHAPACRVSDSAATVEITAAYAGRAYRITARIDDTRFRVDHIESSSEEAPLSPELLVGPVRISNLQAPTP